MFLCVECGAGAWYAVCGVCIVRGASCVVYGVWCAVCVWIVVFGVWFMVCCVGGYGQVSEVLGVCVAFATKSVTQTSPASSSRVSKFSKDFNSDSSNNEVKTFLSGV